MLREFIAEECAIDPDAFQCGALTEVVRCMRCRWFVAGREASYCNWWHRKVPAHGFCHIGQPEEVGE